MFDAPPSSSGAWPTKLKEEVLSIRGARRPALRRAGEIDRATCRRRGPAEDSEGFMEVDCEILLGSGDVSSGRGARP